MPLNVGASLLSTVPAAKLLGHEMLAAEQGVDGAQTKQIQQQTIQRSLINNDPYQLAGAYMPDTLLQNTGLPNSNALLQQAMNDGNPYAGMLQATDADMARIVGLGLMFERVKQLRKDIKEGFKTGVATQDRTAKTYGDGKSVIATA